jgi:excisionase family DNA binding protein
MLVRRKSRKPTSSNSAAQSLAAGPRLLDIPAVAAYLSCHVWAVRRLLHNRELPYIVIGRGFLVDKKDCDAWIERQKFGPTQKAVRS